MTDWIKESANGLPLPMKTVPEAQRIGGSPSTGGKTIGQFEHLRVGVWEMSVGSMRDVEVDELFVVIQGSARVDFEDGTSITLVPGDVGKLRAGQKTVWTVTEPLRKVYLAQ
jgi:uncharacterized cupin superfamily protein